MNQSEEAGDVERLRKRVEKLEQAVAFLADEHDLGENPPPFVRKILSLPDVDED